MQLRPLILLGVFLLVAAGAGAHDPSRAHYIGNEGVLLEHGEVKVLFDAFYSESFGQYVVPDSRTRTALIEGRPPYDGVDAVFVSHIHGDHFSPQPMLDYLRARKNVRLFGPKEMIPALEKAGAGADVLERVTPVSLAPGDAALEFSVEGVEISVVAIPHAGGARMASIRNLVFRVTAGEHVTVLHMGDAGIDHAAFRAQEAHWKARRIHTAFPPYWFIADPGGRHILETWITADQVIGIHVPAEAASEGNAWRERHGGDLFTTPGETRTVGPAED